MILYFSWLSGLVSARQKPALARVPQSSWSAGVWTNLSSPRPWGLSSWPCGHALGRQLGLGASGISPLESVPLFSVWIPHKGSLSRSCGWIGVCGGGKVQGLLPCLLADVTPCQPLLSTAPCFISFIASHHLKWTPRINIFLLRITKTLWALQEQGPA